MPQDASTIEKPAVGESRAASTTPKPVTLIVFSGDFDRVMAAFTMAVGAAASGSKVSMFFTFWGLSVLKKTTRLRGKTFLEKLLAFMLPSGPDRLGTSKMNMGGLGPAFFKRIMKQRKVGDLPQLIDLAVELEVQLSACQTSMEIMGISREELRDEVQVGGVAACLADAQASGVSLFI